MVKALGFYGNIDSHIDHRYYDYKEIWKFQEDLTLNIGDAINEKIDKEKQL